MMHKNYVWLCFLSLITGAVGWYILKTLYAIYLYTLLTAQAPIEQISWGVEQIKEDQYVIRANYTFIVKNKEFEGKTLFTNDIHLNPDSAEASIKVYSSENWPVWFSSRDPRNSSLQKNFPLKESVSAGILWAILLYFYGLGYYVAKRKF